MKSTATFGLSYEIVKGCYLFRFQAFSLGYKQTLYFLKLNIAKLQLVPPSLSFCILLFDDTFNFVTYSKCLYFLEVLYHIVYFYFRVLKGTRVSNLPLMLGC